MMLSQVRWREIPNHLPEDIPQHVFDDNDMVRVLDILEDVLAERSKWVEPDSEVDQERLTNAMEEGGDKVREAMLGVMGELLFRQRLFEETPTLLQVEEKLKMVDVRDTIKEEW